MTRTIMHEFAPSHWAIALINGEEDALTPEDRKAMDAWLDYVGGSHKTVNVVSCDESEMFGRYYTKGGIAPLAGMLTEYTIYLED